MQGLYNQVILTTTLLVFGIMCLFYYKKMNSSLFKSNE